MNLTLLLISLLAIIFVFEFTKHFITKTMFKVVLITVLISIVFFVMIEGLSDDDEFKNSNIILKTGSVIVDTVKDQDVMEDFSITEFWPIKKIKSFFIDEDDW